MEEKFYKQYGFIQTLITTCLIISVEILTRFFKTLFVGETGNISMFSGISLILSIGLILKWKFVRQILSFIVVIEIYAIITMISMTHAEFIVGHSILLLMLTIESYFLILSNAVRDYLNTKSNLAEFNLWKIITKKNAR